MRRVVKEKAIRFTLRLKCVQCGRRQKYIIGYDYESLADSKIHIPTSDWNGWSLSDNTELCPICQVKNDKRIKLRKV